jgi:hypothetical protein
MLTISCLLFGAVLAQRCKVLVLVPAILLVSLVTAVNAARGGGTWHILGATAVGIAALQVGYLGGLGLHYLVNVLQLASMRRNSLHGSMSSRRTAS